MRTLRVLLGESRLGTLEQTDGGERRFTYVDRAEAPISVSMPVRRTRYTHRVVEPFIEGLLPDSTRVREAVARRFNVSPRNPFALLEHIGHDCAGAVRFLRDDEDADPADGASGLVPVTDSDVGHRLAMVASGREPGWIAPGEGWSLAGAQSKIALRREGGQWFEARGSEPTTHILKPGISGMREQALCEHLCLAALRQVGVPAVRTEYLSIAGQKALVIERYDRRRVHQAVLRVHQEDLCQATSTYPHRKYESHGGPGALRIISLLDEVAKDGGASVRRFVDALILNVLLGAPDAHAKNYSIIHAAGQYVLAPVYDLASGLPYNEDGDVTEGQTPWRTVAMSVGGARRLDQIGTSCWERLAAQARLERRARMDADAVVERVHRLSRLLPDALATGIAREQADNPVLVGAIIPSRLLDAVARHCRRVRCLR